jgi:hypothetical protein
MTWFARNSHRIMFASIGAALGMTLASAPAHGRNDPGRGGQGEREAHEPSHGDARGDRAQGRCRQVNARAKKHEVQMNKGQGTRGGAAGQQHAGEDKLADKRSRTNQLPDHVGE